MKINLRLAVNRSKTLRKQTIPCTVQFTVFKRLIKHPGSSNSKGVGIKDHRWRLFLCLFCFIGNTLCSVMRQGGGKTNELPDPSGAWFTLWVNTTAYTSSSALCLNMYLTPASVHLLWVLFSLLTVKHYRIFFTSKCNWEIKWNLMEHLTALM